MIEDDKDYERLLFEQLQIIHESHAKAAKPIIDRIVEIRSRQVNPIFIPIELLSEEQRKRFFVDIPAKEGE